MIRPPFFYGYVIIGLCFLNLFLIRGILASFGVLYVALLDDFEWSRATAASIASANALVYGASSPLVGWIRPAWTTHPDADRGVSSLARA